MRRFALICAAVLAIAVLFYGAVWLWAWSRLDSQIDRAIARHEAAGGEFTASEISVGGFPLSLGARAEDVVLVQPDGVVWRSPSVSGRTVLWALDRIRLAAPEGVEVSAPLAPGLAPLRAASQRAGGEIEHDFGGSPAVLRLRFDAVEVAPPQAGPAAADTVELTVFGADPQGAAGLEGVAVSVDATALALPRAADFGLGGAIDEVGATLSLEGPPPPAFHEAGLDLWRRAGGLVRVQRLHLVWGALGLDGEGTVRLDEALQPLVRLDAEVRGLNRTLAALMQSGTLSLGAATAIGFGFGMLGGPAAQDGATPLAVEIADRQVTVGSARLPGRLPEIDWPDPPAPAIN
jgi:hypothetical protein